MRLEFHNKLTKPLVAQATRLLVRGEDGTPIAIIIEHQPNYVTVHHAGEADFNRQLAMYGIHETVIVNPLDFRTGSPNIHRLKG